MGDRIAPVDLKDEVALRRHLQSTTSDEPTTNNQTIQQSAYSSAFKLPATTPSSLEVYVDKKFNEFDRAWRDVVKEVEYNLQDTDYRFVQSEAYLGENYATITELMGTYARGDAIGAVYGMEVDVNGNITGYKMTANETEAIFQIFADKFLIADSGDPTEASRPVFAIDVTTREIHMDANVNIDGNLIVDDSITTTQLGVIGNAYFTNDAGFGLAADCTNL